MTTLLSRAIARRSSVALLVLAAGCFSSSRERPRTLSAPDGEGRLITAEMIEQYRVASVWDVLRESGYAYRLTESRSGQPSRLERRRGRSSLTLPHSDTPMIIVDGARLAELRTLKDIPASSISSIRLLSGIQGTVYHGTNAGAGVIIISSKTAP